MKPAAILCLSSLFICSGTGFAQDTNGTNAAETVAPVASGLQFETRTEEERVEFLHKVASAYFTEGDLENAINAYERILEIDPVNREARFIIGHVYINAKKYAEAEGILLELIEEYPEDFQLRNNLAWLYATAEDPAFRNGEKAITLAQEALVLAPIDHHVWSTLSEAYYVTGEYEKAYRAIQHMAQIAMRYGKNITQEMVEGYNEQILKCKRAWDSDKALKGEAEENTEGEPAEAASDSTADADQ